MPAPEKLHKQIDILADSVEYTGTGIIDIRMHVNNCGVRRVYVEFIRQLDGARFIVGNPCVGCEK